MFPRLFQGQAALDAENMDNNIAFNVKLTPGPEDSRVETLHHMQACIKSYFVTLNRDIQQELIERTEYGV
ncbi:MAG: hypothetical protein ACQERN_05750 [Thermodesulfobacteriota bacterium]